jgi:hypothetical protein
MCALPDTTPLDIASQDATMPDEPKSKSILSQFIDAIRGSRVKSAIFLFILFILVTSDVFSSTILKKINGAIDSGTGLASPYGVIVQGIILVIGHIFVNFFIDHNMI